MVSAPAIDKEMAKRLDAGTEIKIEGPVSAIPSFTHLISEAPEGMLGDPRAIVDDYDEAMDRITQEILWALSKSNVLSSSPCMIFNLVAILFSQP